MAHLFSTTIAFVLLRLVVCEEFFRSSNSGVFSFGNFVSHKGQKFFSEAKLKEVKVKSSDECLIRCVKTQRCLSVNVNTTGDDQGLYVCELLASDKYENQSNIRPSKEIDHYSIANQCEKKPCKHRGKCVPLYTSSTYKCECHAGTLGKNCQIPDFRSCAQRFTAGCTNSGIYEINTPDKNKIDVYCDHGNDGEGWTMVFKSVSGVSLQQQGPSVLWLSNSLLESSSSALPINSSSRQHYKNRIVEQWQQFNPTQVRLSLYKNKAEVVRLVFNAIGSDKTNWFSRDRLLTSPWTDIHTQPVNFFSIAGHTWPNGKRSFFINSYYSQCPVDLGWMVLLEFAGPCPWENHIQHSVLYSTTNTRAQWSNQDAVSVADMMAIYLR